MPAFEITVPDELYGEVADLLGEPWADSYLHGATVVEERILPRTETAWLRLKAERIFMEIIHVRGIRLIKPLPFKPSTKLKKKAALTK